MVDMCTGIHPDLAHAIAGSGWRSDRIPCRTSRSRPSGGSRLRWRIRRVSCSVPLLHAAVTRAGTSLRCRRCVGAVLALPRRAAAGSLSVPDGCGDQAADQRNWEKQRSQSYRTPQRYAKRHLSATLRASHLPMSVPSSDLLLIRPDVRPRTAADVLTLLPRRAQPSP